MSPKLSIAFFLHSIRSDWNNGNAHYLRGLARALGTGSPFTVDIIPPQGHDVVIYEPRQNWSTENLLTEVRGQASLDRFAQSYPDLHVLSYDLDRAFLRKALGGRDIVIVHEWNPPALIELILSLRDELGFRALFHDTHHRASSTPEQMHLLQVARFDGVIAFGQALRQIYLRNFGLTHVWTLHEAADTTVFHPRQAAKSNDVVWIGNWGDNERSQEIREYLISPAASLEQRRFCIYGVRYPQEGLDALADAGITYGGYLPNLEAPAAYADSQVTIHIPRQQYAGAMAGIPTIRVFEALASGIPLISAPWQDSENLFREGDFLFVHSTYEMKECIEHLLTHSSAAPEQAARGLATIRAHHTCGHRAKELANVCYEVIGK
jgi:spore maturation protein CgeB